MTNNFLGHGSELTHTFCPFSDVCEAYPGNSLYPFNPSVKIESCRVVSQIII